MLVNQVEMCAFVDRHNRRIRILTFAIGIALGSYCSAAALSLEDVALFKEIDSNHTKNFNEASRNILHADFDRRRRSSGEI